MLLSWLSHLRRNLRRRKKKLYMQLALTEEHSRKKKRRDSRCTSAENGQARQAKRHEEKNSCNMIISKEKKKGPGGRWRRRRFIEMAGRHVRVRTTRFAKKLLAWYCPSWHNGRTFAASSAAIWRIGAAAALRLANGSRGLCARSAGDGRSTHQRRTSGGNSTLRTTAATYAHQTIGCARATRR